MAAAGRTASDARQSITAVTGVTWHKLTLINGWTSSQNVYGTGNPRYAISGGVVYLSGSLHAGTSTSFAVLPKAARPAHWLYMTAGRGVVSDRLDHSAQTRPDERVDLRPDPVRHRRSLLRDQEQHRVLVRVPEGRYERRLRVPAGQRSAGSTHLSRRLHV